jgi:hypothetical protein
MEKCRIYTNNLFVKEQRERDLKIMREDYQLLALKTLFIEEQAALFQTKSEFIFSVEELTRVGIVQASYDGKLQFINSTFADYYVAECLVNCLTKGNNISEQVQTFIRKDIFLREDYRLVRVFMDGLLQKSKLKQQALEEYGNQIYALWKEQLYSW